MVVWGLLLLFILMSQMILLFQLSPLMFSCYSYNDGSIDLIIQGGTGAITTNWSGPNGYSMIAEDIYNLSPGIYAYISTDIFGCSPSSPSIPIVIG